MSDDPTRPYAGKLCKVYAGAGGDGGVRHSPGEPPDPPWCCEACNGTGEDPDSEAGLLRARVAELEAEREWYRQALTGATGQDLAHFTECMATAGPFCPPVNLRVGGIHRARFDAEAERDHQASLRERAAALLADCWAQWSPNGTSGGLSTLEDIEEALCTCAGHKPCTRHTHPCPLGFRNA